MSIDFTGILPKTTNLSITHEDDIYTIVYKETFPNLPKAISDRTINMLKERFDEVLDGNDIVEYINEDSIIGVTVVTPHPAKILFGLGTEYLIQGLFQMFDEKEVTDNDKKERITKSALKGVEQLTLDFIETNSFVSKR